MYTKTRGKERRKVEVENYGRRGARRQLYIGGPPFSGGS